MILGGRFGRAMVAYRLYCLDGLGKIGHVEVLDAHNDEAALRIARDRKLEISCEVWDRDRLVGHVRAHSSEPPFA